MKTKEEKIEYYEHLIKRKENIKVGHLFAIKKHSAEIDQCEAYIEKYKKALESLKNT